MVRRGQVGTWFCGIDLRTTALYCPLGMRFRAVYHVFDVMWHLCVHRLVFYRSKSITIMIALLSTITAGRSARFLC